MDFSELATGRQTSLFEADLARTREQLLNRLAGRKVLVIGGAGSIGAATLKELMPFRPHTIHLVDQNENGLAELVRDLRSQPGGLQVPEFRTLPIDFGSAILHRFLREQNSYDFVLNFAALKHVRSDKDTYSVLQMLNTNVVKTALLLRWLQEREFSGGFFCVSTDKAANPVNLMGASKRLMEHVIFSQAKGGLKCQQMTSARFANVAFSDGSLLQSWLIRMQKKQPLAVPRGVRRFFISLREAGQLCLVASICGPTRHILIPRLDPETELRDLQQIACKTLNRFGFEADIYSDEEAARSSVNQKMQEGKYPLLVTKLDTAGEKPFEEFVGVDEQVVEIGMDKLLGIPYRELSRDRISEFVAWVQYAIEHPCSNITRTDIEQRLEFLLEEFRYAGNEKCLDDRM